jgi:hypothetical protein
MREQALRVAVIDRNIEHDRIVLHHTSCAVLYATYCVSQYIPWFLERS